MQAIPLSRVPLSAAFAQMTNDDGKKIESAGPSVPVEIIGLAEVPGAATLFDAVDDEKMARELVEQRKDKGEGKSATSCSTR